jgi:DNA-binding winged helix-turn-helix (wHTH) protein/Tol biopolymer transport system component
MFKQPRHLFEFGRFRLDRTERFLFQDGAAVPLTPRLFETLLILVENRGHVVEKKELMQRVWNDVAVEENNLTQNISALRRILGDNLDGPKFIETIPKRGYRFVAPVKEVSEEEPRADTPSFTNLSGREHRGTGPPARVGPQKHSRRIAPAIVLGTMLLGLMGLAVMWRSWTRWGKQLQLKETQLTTNSSEASVIAAAISPDGKYLAYADKAGLYVRVNRTGEMHPISVPPASVIAGLSWFPDGTRLLATVTGLQPNVDSVWVISILGQFPVKLMDGGNQAAVSPDGSQIVFVRGKGKELWLMAADGESPHRILVAANEYLAGPVWGWDSKHLAYGRVFSDLDKLDTVVETLDLETGKITASFSDPEITSGIPLPDGRLVYSRNEVISGQSGASLSGASLLEANTDPGSGKLVGKPRQLARWPGSSISGLGVTSDGMRLVALKGLVQADVYVGDIVEHRLKNARRLTFNDRDDFAADWTPDGHYVLFASNRNGSMDIFRQGVEEPSAEALITGPDDKLSLHVSPDGQWLMYFAFPGGYSATKAPLLMRAPLSGGSPHVVFKARPASDFHCLKAPATMCVLSEWENQQLVFYVLDPIRGKGRELARQEIASGPEIVESNWDISPDGSRIALAMPEGPPARIRILSLAGLVLQDLRVSGWSAFQSMEWSADGKGWFVASRSAAANTLLFVDPQGHAYPLRQTAGSYDTYAIPSPDGHRLAFLEYTTANNAWMFENF